MEEVTRVKALLISDDNEILLCNSENQYHFPGGHVEAGEDLLTALNREIKEETGINIDTKDLPLFHEIHYNAVNRKINIYYYVIKSNKKVNYHNINRTKEEIDGRFRLRHVNIKDVEKLLNDNLSMHPKNRYIVPEMLEVLKKYEKEKEKKQGII